MVESEAEAGSEYSRDYLGVLRDFKFLAHQLRNLIHNPYTKQALFEGALYQRVAAMY